MPLCAEYDAACTARAACVLCAACAARDRCAACAECAACAARAACAGFVGATKTAAARGKKESFSFKVQTPIVGRQRSRPLSSLRFVLCGGVPPVPSQCDDNRAVKLMHIVDKKSYRGAPV